MTRLPLANWVIGEVRGLLDGEVKFLLMPMNCVVGSVDSEAKLASCNSEKLAVVTRCCLG